MAYILYLFQFLVIFIILQLNSLSSTIYIYNDSGTGPRSVQPCVKFFHELLPDLQVESIHAESVKEGNWRDNAALFVIPGGAAGPIAQKLNGQGNDQIRSFIYEGGRYLGICAGAYYASKTTLFDIGGPNQVYNEKELQLFLGEAIGPVIKSFNYANYNGMGLVSMTFDYNNWDQFKGLHLVLNGGCYFQNASNKQVIARYETIHHENQLSMPSHAPGIIYQEFGKGHVILSGVHFEYDPTDFLENYVSPKDPQTLALENLQRIKLGQKLMGKMGLKFEQNMQ